MNSAKKLPVRAALTFLMAFGLAKAVAFTAALALPRTVDARTYGSLEVAMSVGMIGATILGLGGPGVAFRTHLMAGDSRAKAILILHCLGLSALGTASALLFTAVGVPTLYVICAAILSVYGFQLSASTYVRMHGKVMLSGWFDNIGVILLFALASSVGSLSRNRESALATALIFVSCVLLIGCVLLLQREKPFRLEDAVRQVVANGAPMMMYGLATMIFSGTIRIAIANELGVREVAAYAVCARVALVLLFASQVVQIGLLTKLYKLENTKIGRLFTLWILSISAISLLVSLAAHEGAAWMVLGTEIRASEAIDLFPSVAVQTALLALLAILEPYINRELLSQRAWMVALAIAVPAFLIGAVWTTMGDLSLRTIVNLYSVVTAGAIVAQMRLLSQKGMNFGTSHLALPATAAPLLTLLL